MVTCPRCGTQNPQGFRFCGTYAAPLEAAVPAVERRKVVTVLFSGHLADVMLHGRGPVAAAGVLGRALDYFERKEATGVAARIRTRLAEIEAQGEAGGSARPA